MAPLIEIVICTYNRANDLDRCLDKLARQEADIDAWSVTVVDNNCSDSTPQVVARHQSLGNLPRLRCIHEARQGLTPARQRGIMASRAPWVAFVDDDCLVAPDWVSSALGCVLRHEDAAGVGGVVSPSWGGIPAAHVARHGWLFAQQDHGQADVPVESLVGAGMIVNRGALTDCGWVDEPYLADRTGLGYTSGGDVEICFRMTSTGRRLWYCPCMRIEHVVSRQRQRLRSLMGLAYGLGAGASLVNLMGCADGDAWPAHAGQSLSVEWRGHWLSVPYVIRGRYAWQDWLIRAAFLSGRGAQITQLAADEGRRRQLTGVWTARDPG
jgi:glycosyltransferase involved in cell wall biosynthesis